MNSGPQDGLMRDLISRAVTFLSAKGSEQAAHVLNDAMARAQAFLHEAIGENQEGASAISAAHRAAVLAIVRAAVDAGFSRPAARSAAARAYWAPTGRVSQWDTLLNAEDPLAILKKGNLSNGLKREYGDSLVGHDEKGEDHADLVITTCAYNDFFRKHGEPDLTFIFCGADWFWMEKINASDRPIAIERPTTLSTGASQCRFHFVRADPARKPQSDVVRSVPAAQFD